MTRAIFESLFDGRQKLHCLVHYNDDKVMKTNLKDQLSIHEPKHLLAIQSFLDLMSVLIHFQRESSLLCILNKELCPHDSRQSSTQFSSVWRSKK